MTTVLGAAAYAMTRDAQGDDGSIHSLHRFPGNDETWKRSWELATWTLAGNTLQLGTYDRPVLIAGQRTQIRSSNL